MVNKSLKRPSPWATPPSALSPVPLPFPYPGCQTAPAAGKFTHLLPYSLMAGLTPLLVLANFMATASGPPPAQPLQPLLSAGVRQTLTQSNLAMVSFPNLDPTQPQAQNPLGHPDQSCAIPIAQ